MDRRGWLYFGCHQTPEHLLFMPGMRVLHPSPRSPLHMLVHLNGRLCPQGDDKPYVPAISRLSVLGLSAMGFWDHSVSTEPRAHSVVYAPSLTISGDGLLLGLQSIFPEVWNRLPTFRLPRTRRTAGVPDGI